MTCSKAYHLQSKKFNFLLKVCVKILFCWHYFSPLNTFMRKREGSGAGSAPLTNGSGSGRSKNMRILRIWIRIPNTAWKSEWLAAIGACRSTRVTVEKAIIAVAHLAAMSSAVSNPLIYGYLNHVSSPYICYITLRLIQADRRHKNWNLAKLNCCSPFNSATASFSETLCRKQCITLLCGWNIAECGWGLAECGWDLADCGWDLADYRWDQGDTKTCRLSLLTNSTLVYESNAGGWGKGVAGSQPIL